MHRVRGWCPLTGMTWPCFLLVSFSGSLTRRHYAAAGRERHFFEVGNGYYCPTGVDSMMAPPVATGAWLFEPSLLTTRAITAMAKVTQAAIATKADFVFPGCRDSWLSEGRGADFAAVTGLKLVGLGAIFRGGVGKAALWIDGAVSSEEVLSSLSARIFSRSWASSSAFA